MDAKLAIGIPAMAMETEPLYVVDLIDFEDLYRREYPGLVAVAAALSGASRDAEDLVQDTMVKALINWKRVQRLDRPGGWCHRVLLNICHNWRRRRGTEARFVSRLRRSEPPVPVHRQLPPRFGRPSANFRPVHAPPLRCTTPPTGQSPKSPSSSASLKEP